MIRVLPRRLAVLLLLVLGAALAPAATAQEDDPADPGPVPGEIGQREPGKRLYDMADVFDDAQEWQIEHDAARLARHGIPNVIIVQSSNLSPEQAAAFAADVRETWDVESAAGAADGLVIYVAVNPEGEGAATSVMSWGESALPHFGVNTTTASAIETDWLEANMAEGNVYEAIDHTLRRLIYHSIYDPAPQQPLGSSQERAGTLVSIAGPILAIGAAALAALRWRRPPRVRGRSAEHFLMLYAVPTVALLVAALAVWSRSGWGVLAALAMLGLWTADWVRQDPGASRPAPNRGQAYP